MKKLLSVMLIFCLFANAVGFAELAETMPELTSEATEITSEASADEVSGGTLIESDTDTALEISVQPIEDGTRLSVACNGEVVWQEQPGSDISEADEEAWVSIADGADYLAAPETDTLYRAIADGVASEPVAVAAVDKTEVSEVVEEAEEAEPILSLNPIEEEPILALENDEDSREVDLQTPEISDTELDEPTPNTPAYVLSGNNVVASGKSVTLTVKQGDTVVKAATLNWKSDNTSIATVSAGKVTAKKVTEVTPVTITATSKTDATLSGSFDITVYPATTKVTITSTKTSIDLDTETLSLTAESLPKNAYGKVTWKTSNANIATVTDGVVSPVAVGKVTITATAADGTGKYGTIVLNVIKAVKGITIEGSTKMAAGKSVTLKAVCEPTNATNQKVKWESEQPSVATVSTSGVVKAIRQTEGKTVTIKATSLENGEKIATHTIEICPIVTKVELKADQTFIDFTEGKGKTLQINAACTPEGTSQGVTWKTSNVKIAMVNDNGLVTAEGMGKATITATATDGSGKSGTFVVNVVKAVTGITVEGPEAMLAGKSVTLKATCNPKDATNKKVTWASNDEDGEVTVSTSGVVKASAKMSEKKTVIITATSVENPSITKEHKITVCPAVTAVTITADANRTFIDITDATNENPQKLQLKATCTPDTASQSVTWKTSSTKIATVDENGLVTAVGVGKATITATAADGTGKSKTYVVSVVKGLRTITITGDKEIVTGKTATLKASLEPTTATNKGIKWESKNTTVATVSSAGVVKAAANLKESKTVTITATGTSAENAEVVGSYEIKVCPVATGVTIRADKTLIDLNEENKTLQLTAVCAPEEHAKQGVTWKTNNRVVATVDANGLVTAKSTGKVTITATATDGSGKSGTIELSVVYAVTGITLSSKEESVLDGSTVALTATVAPEGATNKKIVWSSSNEKIATVDASGKVTVKEVENVETVTITAASEENDNFKDTCEITVTPTVKNITIVNPTESNIIDLNGEPTLSLSATVIPAAAAQEVRWTSSNEEVATVDTEGKVTGLSAGKVTITATATDGCGKSGSIELSVVCAVTGIRIVSEDEIPESGKLPGNKTLNLRADITPTNAGNKGVLWTSSNPSVAKVDSTGKVTLGNPKKETAVMITATSAENAKILDTVSFSVYTAVERITLESSLPDNVNVVDLKDKWGWEPLTVTASCAPAEALQEVSWSVSNAEAAEIVSGDVTHCTVQFKAVGTVVLTAEAKDGSGVKINKTITVKETGAYSLCAPFVEISQTGTTFNIHAYGKMNADEMTQGACGLRVETSTTGKEGSYTVFCEGECNSDGYCEISKEYTEAVPGTPLYLRACLYNGETYSRVVEQTLVLSDFDYSSDGYNASITGYRGTATKMSLPSSINNLSVTSVGDKAFYQNEKLTSVTIPKGVTSIGEYAFSGCKGLTSISIPVSVTSIKKYAFSSCTGLKSVSIPKDVTTLALATFLNCSGLTSVSIPDGVTSIGNSVFNGCTGLTSVTIPDSVNSIGTTVFSGCKGLESVSIPDGVTAIKRNAFNGCTGLTSVTIPDSVTSIDDNAFSGCTGLTSVTIPQNVAAIIRTAFSGCTGLSEINVAEDNATYCSVDGVVYSKNLKTLTICPEGKASVTIPDGVTEIGLGAFYGCTGLTSVTIPDGVTSIGSSAFYGCTGLTSVTIPDGVTSIGSSAFYGCTGLKSVTISDGVTEIGLSAFKDCTGLESVTIPDSVTSIERSAFSGCTGLKSVTIPDGVTSIGSSAFSGCTGLESVTIPDGVTSISSSAFSGCTGLKSVTISDGVTEIGLSAFKDCTGLESVTIPDGVTSIGSSAFSGCTGLTSVSIPNGVTAIGKTAFANCPNLTRVDLGDDIRATDSASASNVFSGSDAASFRCKRNSTTDTWLKASIDFDRIVYNSTDAPYFDFVPNDTGVTIIGYTGTETEVVIPNQLDGSAVTVIGDGVFRSCSGMTSVTLPNSVKTIGDGAFSGCSGLTSIAIPDSAMFKQSFSECENITSVTLLEGCTSIGSKAFDNCSSLKSISIPKSLMTVAAGAFYDCTGLESVTIPESGVYYEWFSRCKSITSVTVLDRSSSIEKASFSDTGLVSVNIVGNVTSIEQNAFRNCRELKFISIPDSVTFIGDGAFACCSKLESFYLSENVNVIGSIAFWSCTSLQSVTLACKSEVTIHQSAFSNCPQLKSVTLGNTVGFREGFRECSSITTVTILEGCSTIADRAFQERTRLNSVTFPESLRTVEECAFEKCSGLTSISFPKGLTELGAGAFSGCSGLESVTLPQSLSVMGCSAFSYCGKLEDIYLGDNIDSKPSDLAEFVFEKCNIVKFHCTKDSATDGWLQYSIDPNRIIYN